MENAIFIGKDGSYNSNNTDTQSNHPGQGDTDQRFDALGIRVKVEMLGVDLYQVSGNPIRPAIDLYFTRSNKITFHFLPLIKK